MEEIERCSSTASDVELPGFRFHPTEEELLGFYLWRVVHGKKLHFEIIQTLNLYRHDPWELPGLAKIGEREWYFFVPRDRRQANGGRPNRTTERGFWKATGSDRPIRSTEDPRRLIGVKKTLVFYIGRAPRGTKTDWVMNEYRLPDKTSSSSSATLLPQEDIVLCKVYRKATSLKELEQRAAMEEELRASTAPSLSVDANSTSFDHDNYIQISTTSSDGNNNSNINHKADEISNNEEEKKKEAEVCSASSRTLINLPEVQVPAKGLEWMQDSFLTELRSPWLDPLWSPYPNALNF